MLLRAVANWSIWPARTAISQSGNANAKLLRKNKAVQDYIARQMAAPRKKNAKRGETRAGKAPSKRKGAVAAATDPSRPARRDAPYTRAGGSGLHLAVFCVPHFTWAAAAETLPQRHQQATHSYS